MIATLPAATLFWAGTLGVVMTVLAFRVPLRRRALGVSLGDGGDGDLLARIRAFGNFSEFVPMILMLLALVELSGGARWSVHVAGALLLVARIAHGAALTAGEMSPNQRAGRMFGSAITFLILIVFSVYAIVLAI